MHRIRSGTPQRHAPLAPASFVRSLQGGVLLVAAVVVAVSFMGPGQVVKLGIGLAFGLICLSLVPLTGWGGYVSICQLTFAGLGAFAMYKFGSGGSLVGLVAAAALAGVVGALVALPALRLRGLYLALATMAFASAMDNAFFPWSAVFGFNGSVAIHRPDLFGLNVSSDKGFTIFLAVVFALFSIGVLALRRGPFGRVLVGMKDSEAACATLGLSLTTTKLIVFTLSAAMAGVAGALYGGAESVAGGTNFEMFESLLILAVVAIGGASVCSGALAGGLALGFLPIDAQDVFIGAGTVTLAFYPDGVLPLAYSRFNRWWSRVAAPGDAAVPTRARSGRGRSPGPGRPEPGRRPPGQRPDHPPAQVAAIVGPPGSRYHLIPAMCGFGRRVSATHMESHFQYREVARAHNRPARPQGTAGQGDQDQDPGPEGRAPAAGGVHPRLHDHAEEAELGAAQGGPRPPVLGRGDHGLHPGRRAQPPGALHRPGPWRACEGPAGRALQGRARGARHLGRARAQPGP